MPLVTLNKSMTKSELLLVQTHATGAIHWFCNSIDEWRKIHEEQHDLCGINYSNGKRIWFFFFVSVHMHNHLLTQWRHVKRYLGCWNDSTISLLDCYWFVTKWKSSCSRRKRMMKGIEEAREAIRSICSLCHFDMVLKRVFVPIRFRHWFRIKIDVDLLVCVNFVWLILNRWSLFYGNP